MLIPRKAHGTAYLKGYIYVFRGFSDGGKILDSCEKFDIQNGNWSHLSNLNYARGYATSCIFGEI